MSLMWDEWDNPELLSRWGLSDTKSKGHGDSALNSTAKSKSPAIWACLGVNRLDMPRTLYLVIEGKHSQ